MLNGAPSFLQMVVFGDSLSDTGNVTEELAREAGYEQHDGRFTSGPSLAPPSSGKDIYVWHEVLAKHLAIDPPSPASTGGTNYATGGAETAADLVSVKRWLAGKAGLNGEYGLPDIDAQLSKYRERFSRCPEGTLYTVWGGGNDLIDSADWADGDSLFRDTVDPHEFDSAATGAVDNLKGYVDQLVEAGAEYIIWSNLPELDQIPHTGETHSLTDPLHTGPPAWLASWFGITAPYEQVNGYTPATKIAVANAVQTFNLAWKSAIEDYSSAAFHSSHPGVTIYGLDVHNLFEEMLNKTYPGVPKNFNTTEEASRHTLMIAQTITSFGTECIQRNLCIFSSATPPAP